MTCWSVGTPEANSTSNRPANLVLKVTTPTFWLPTLSILWGIVCLTQGLVHNEAGLYAARFFLGIVEAGLFPGVIYTFSMYYKRKERTIRCSFYFSAAAASGAFGGVLAYGLGRINAGGKPGWSWIFIVEGLLTVVVGVIAYFLVPTWPSKTKHLTTREKAILEHRLQNDSDAVEIEGFQWSEVFRATKSPQVYGYCFLFHGFSFGLYTLSLFIPTIIQGLGYKSWEAQLLSVPPYVFAFIVTMTTAWISNRCRLRAPFIVAIIGYIALLTSPTIGGQYTALFLCTAGVYSGNALLLAWPSENLMGQTYRATGLAMVIGIGDVGAIIGTQLYSTPLGGLANEKFKYSHIFAIVWLVIGIISASLLYFGLQRENKRLELQEQQQIQELESKDAKVTQSWQRSFRYQL
jgi:MFS family permease